MPVTILLTRLNWALGIAALALTALGLLSELLLSFFGVDWAFGLVPLLNLSYETNIAAWYTSLLLFGCGAVLACIAWLRTVQDAPFARHWAGLAAILAILSMNELVRVHEVINPALTDTHSLGGIFSLSWVIPGALLAALFAAAYRDFYGHLPRRLQPWFAAACALYVGGGLIAELALSLWYDSHGGSNLVFGLLNLAQGSIQILGASVLLSTLIALIGAEIGELRIAVRPVLQEESVARKQPEPEQTQEPGTPNAVTGILKLAKYLPRY